MHELRQGTALGHRIGVAEIDQRCDEVPGEQQEGRRRGAGAGLGAPGDAQHHAQAGGQRVYVLEGHRIESPGRRDHEAIDVAQPVSRIAGAGCIALGDEVVDAIQALDITVEAVHEGTVEQVPDDLGDGGGVARDRRVRRQGTLPVRTHADDEEAVGTEVQGRTQGCELAHRAVAEVLELDPRGGEHRRNRR